MPNVISFQELNAADELKPAPPRASMVADESIQSMEQSPVVFCREKTPCHVPWLALLERTWPSVPPAKFNELL